MQPIEFHEHDKSALSRALQEFAALPPADQLPLLAFVLSADFKAALGPTRPRTSRRHSRRPAASQLAPAVGDTPAIPPAKATGRESEHPHGDPPAASAAADPPHTLNAEVMDVFDQMATPARMRQGPRAFAGVRETEHRIGSIVVTMVLSFTVALSVMLWRGNAGGSAAHEIDRSQVDAPVAVSDAPLNPLAARRPSAPPATLAAAVMPLIAPTLTLTPTPMQPQPEYQPPSPPLQSAMEGPRAMVSQDFIARCLSSPERINTSICRRVLNTDYKSQP